MGSTKRGWLWLVTIGTDDTSDGDADMRVTLDSCLLNVDPLFNASAGVITPVK